MGTRNFYGHAVLPVHGGADGDDALAGGRREGIDHGDPAVRKLVGELGSGVQRVLVCGGHAG